MRFWVPALFALSCVSLNLQAATVYKKVDEDGNIIFSDTPMDDSEVLDVPPVPTMKLDHGKRQLQPTSGSNKKTTFKYEGVTITKPAQDEHFINNQGMVTVTVQVSPALKDNHQLQLLLNGVKRAGPGAVASFSFSNLDRGSYSAIAQVVDNKGNVVISSEAVTFHVKRASRLN